MWKHVSLALAFVGLFSIAAGSAACGNKNVKPTGLDGGDAENSEPATSESQPSH